MFSKYKNSSAGLYLTSIWIIICTYIYRAQILVLGKQHPTFQNVTFFSKYEAMCSSTQTEKAEEVHVALIDIAAAVVPLTT